MSRTAAGIAAALCLGAGAASADDGSAIRNALTRWTEAFNAGDSAHVCDLFARELVADYQGGPQKSYESLCAGLRKALADRSTSRHYTPTIHEIILSGDLAVVRLAWRLTVTHPDTGTSETTSDEGLDVFRRQPDGSWKIVRFLAYPIPGR